MTPAPRFAYELADEMGVLLMAETAIYGQPNPILNPMPQAKRRIYVENTKQWLGPWVRSRRNYTSNFSRRGRALVQKIGARNGAMLFRKSTNGGRVSGSAVCARSG